MNAHAIEVEGLGKQYRIGRRMLTLRERLSRLRAAPFRTLSALLRRPDKTPSIWALRDISFQVEQGEVLGLIGRNGAGKSTLLKILSRITEPTVGRARVHGRVGSLLEVGTGFHPELTGRENVFLNGAILGMRSAEIHRKFDEIVDFAGVETFIDTPVKRYSTGMFVRLAFAVAAHLETEVLLVDEVLAVGDAEFQEKCLGKLGEVATAGRTVLFVSHVMPMIQTLCDRVLLMEGGRLAADGAPAEVIDRYLADPEVTDESAVRDVSGLPRSAGRHPMIREAWTENEKGERTRRFLMGEPVRICFRYELDHDLRHPGFGLGIDGAGGQRIASLNNYMLYRRALTPPRRGVCSFHLPEPRLLAGRYWLSLAVVEDRSEWVDYVERALPITIVAGDVFGTGEIADVSQGLVWMPGEIDVG